MSAAHLSTLHAEFSVGLVGLQRHKMPCAFNALVSTLAKLQEPIVLTSANTVVRGAPDGSVTALKFRHLRARSVEFANQAAFIASVNPHRIPVSSNALRSSVSQPLAPSLLCARTSSAITGEMSTRATPAVH